MFNADLRKADKKCGHQIVLALLLPCKICKKKKCFMKTILKVMVKISLLRLFFLLLFCFHFYLCCGNDLGRLKFFTPWFHSLYWERYGE